MKIDEMFEIIATRVKNNVGLTENTNMAKLREDLYTEAVFECTGGYEGLVNDVVSYIIKTHFKPRII